MPLSPYAWNPSDPPPVIELHSLTKHQVLERYLARYFEILTSKPSIDRFNVSLVDAFAGGGMYRRRDTGQLHEGSPLILLRAVEQAQAAAQTLRKKQFRLNARFLFIEKRKPVFDHLSATLRERGRHPDQDDRVTLVHGSFDEQLDRVLKELGPRSQKRRVVFLLDQYGYVDAPIKAIRRIFSVLPRSEVILTFAVDWLTGYMTDSPTCRRNLAELDPNLDFDKLLKLMQEDSESGNAMVQRELYQAIVSRSGAKFYTPFFIKSQQANRSYWFLHLSAHSKARDAMTELHWDIQNAFTHYGTAGLDMLGYDPSNYMKRNGQRVFLFDEDAKQLSRDTLRIDLARHFYAKPDQPFGNMFEATCNTTPATKNMMREVVRDLVADKQLTVRKIGQDRERRLTLNIDDDDIVSIPTQVTMFGSNGKPWRSS